jgi:hypothetical protein
MRCFGLDQPRQNGQLPELARFKIFKILNRVSAKAEEIPKAEHKMKTTHITLDAV